MAAKKSAKRKAAAKKAARKTAKKKASGKKAAKKAARKKAAAKQAKKKAGKKAAKSARKGAKKAAAEASAVAEAAPDAEGVEDAEPPEPTLPPMPKMPPRRKDGVLTLGYGTAADQAFMVYALAEEKVETEGRSYELIRKPLRKLREDALGGRHDVTAFSFGSYPEVMDRYLLLACGGSYGDHQGPGLVARTPIRASEVNGLPVAVPSARHTAALALRLWLPKARIRFVEVPSELIGLSVRAGKVRSGLLVNEDQVTYRTHGLVRVVDLGHWWGERTEGLPLAVTAVGIRRDIEEEERAKIALDLKRSIAYALGHREAALDWAMQFAGKRTRESLDAFVNRYVNDLSLDCGERGRQAASLLFRQAYEAGMLPEPVHLFYA